MRLLTPRRLLKPVRRISYSHCESFAVGAEAACAGAHQLAHGCFLVSMAIDTLGW